jgi:aerobic-type carbon monoxide dehydrogenase small subunit (CoxS/CutS family)
MEFDSLAELQAHFEAEHPEGVGAIPGVIQLTVNGTSHTLKVKDSWTLLFVLREKLGLFGAKRSCNRGECGTCTILVNGKAIYSCMMLAIEANGANVVTVEGLSDGVTLSSVQQKFYDAGAYGCGFCTPGMIMAAKALLDKKPNPTYDEAREALSGHICVCGGHALVLEAVTGIALTDKIVRVE